MDLPALLSGDILLAKTAIKDFVHLFSQKFSTIEKWKEIWNATFGYLELDEAEMRLDCLSAVRILSRDKTHMDDVITEQNIQVLLRLANIDPTSVVIAPQSPVADDCVVVESLKCLCNLVFNSATCQNLFERLNGVDGILKRIRSYKDNAVKYDIQFFDMKLLFLITALNTNARQRVREDLNGVVYLTELIDAIVQERISDLPVWFEDREIDLICEILKLLFNLTSYSDSEAEQENELQFCRLAGVLRNTLLRAKTTNREKRQDLLSNVINLVSSLPNASLIEMAPNIVRGGGGDENVMEFESHDITALATFTDFLRGRLEGLSKTAPGSSEKLGPILTVLIKCCRSHRIPRRYIRSVVLPPLSNAMMRPEEGSETKNILCRLLTSANTQVRDLVAELLFICCKESVPRMAKHTGYGNSLGMFASRGLLGSDGVAPSQEYSSDSDDSDTEEYRRIEHAINPVTGCFEPPRPNPFENMSDEQKEYEAMKLVNLIDQLDRQGIIKPARIGADGKPEAVDHVLQLQEATNIPPKQS